MSAVTPHYNRADPVDGGATVLDDLIIYAETVTDPDETAHIAGTMHFIEIHGQRAFERRHDIGGHVGASAVVFHAATRSILLTRHRVLGTWAFFGNHCDGDPDLIQVAHNRIVKDAGAILAEGCMAQPFIFDVDIHHVPPYGRHESPVPAHLHYDIAYLFESSMIGPLQPGTQWFRMDTAQHLNPADPQFIRVLTKIQGLGIQRLR